MVARLMTKEQMIGLLKEIQARGWIASDRPLNSGGIGNTIDSLLGLSENNLPIQDTAQWEMKTHRVGSASLLTLFHLEPEPRNEQIVARLLLPKYGWPDHLGRVDEWSFRQTLRASTFTDRGFRIEVLRPIERVIVHFDAGRVAGRHEDWLTEVEKKAGHLRGLNPVPFWEFQPLFLKASTKLLNAFYVEVETRRAEGHEYFRIVSVSTLQGFDLDRFLVAIEEDNVLVDFDARSSHNHGTKFRIRQNIVPNLYRYPERVL